MWEEISDVTSGLLHTFSMDVGVRGTLNASLAQNSAVSIYLNEIEK